MHCDSVTGCHLSTPPLSCSTSSNTNVPSTRTYFLSFSQVGRPESSYIQSQHYLPSSTTLLMPLGQGRSCRRLEKPCGSALHMGKFSCVYVSLKNRDQGWVILVSTALAINTPNAPTAQIGPVHILLHIDTCECLYTHRNIHTSLFIGTSFFPGQSVYNDLFHSCE